MKKYFVTLEFPAPDNCYHGEVAWEQVEAKNEEAAKKKARLAVLHRIQVNKIEEIVEKNAKP
jgi:hypothetical protein